MGFTVIIPARYQSSRLPGKVLLDIAGKPMIQHVVERAWQSQATAVYVATDDSRIQQCCEDFGARVCMTASTHQSGTDRLAEAVQNLGLAGDD
ncbi:MAG: NTP transferase domain-containing protein, partial [Pseudomonadales bacterium]|nr:NTP transferase domain-containing protein [Pseudomonadales bacterium]